MSAVNAINANNQASSELQQDKMAQSSRASQEAKKAEQVNITDKIALAEQENKNTEKDSQKAAEMTPAQLEKVAQQLQEFMGEMNRSLEFFVDKDSGRDVIKVLDKGTGELVKQYPSEEVLSLVSKLSDATGNLIDTEI